MQKRRYLSLDTYLHQLAYTPISLYKLEIISICHLHKDPLKRWKNNIGKGRIKYFLKGGEQRRGDYLNKGA